MSDSVTQDDATRRPDIAQSIDVISRALSEMKFGAITLTVHDAKVVQLDITEKRRFAG